MDTVEILDPTHPLYGKTLPLVGITTKKGLGRAAIVWIDPGIERLVPLRATSLAEVPATPPLALNTEGYPDSQIARRLTEEGFHSARGGEGVPERFVTEVRREHGRGSVSKELRNRQKLDGCWTVLGLSQELGVKRGRIYKLVREGTLKTERHPQTGNHLIEDHPGLITELRTRLAAKPQNSSGNATT